MLCTKCNVEKPEDEFPWRNKEKGLRRRQCKTCNRSYHNSWYATSSKPDASKWREGGQWFRDRRSYLASRRKRNMEIVVEHLLQHPCVDCGETDPLLLDFDHRDRGTKEASIAWMSTKGVRENRLRAEMDKCDVRCLRCHRVKTALELNWSIVDYLQSIGQWRHGPGTLAA